MFGSVRKRIVEGFSLAWALTSCVLWAVEGTARVPAIDDLLGLKLITSASISPDGKRVAFLERSADFEQDSFLEQLWLVETSGAPAVQLTRSKESVANPKWSPDGRWLSFLRKHEGKLQVFVIPPDGGESVRLTRTEEGVQAHEWSPDGSQIAFIACLEETESEKTRKKNLGDYVVVRRDYRFNHLRVIEVKQALQETSGGTQLTFGGEFSVLDFSWSPDSQQLAFSAVVNPDLVNHGTADVYLLDLQDKSVEKTVSLAGPDTGPHWSPDGLQIVFSSYLGEEMFFARNRHLALIPSEMNKPLSLTQDFDESCSFVDWKREGVYFTAQQRTSSHLFRVDPETRDIRKLTEPDDLMATSFTLSSDGRQVAFVANTNSTLPEVYVSEVEAFQPRRLTHSTRQTGPFRMASREVVSWESRDGTRIEGVLLKPSDFDPARKYPLLCVIHGGPTGIDLPSPARGTRYYPVDTWVGRGALVLRVNYRGSGGYGEKFRRLNIRNLGVGDAWDVLSGIDHLVEKGWVDPERVGCMGWSQGGYISAFLTTSSSRFRATSVGAGISDWSTYYYNTDITPFTINYLGLDPVADPEIYRLTSPVSYVRQAQTPTLIQHGEFDRRVPPANAYQLRQALEDRGIPAELIIYKGFGHGIDKPKSMRAVMQHNLEWFYHYLWGDPPPDFTRMKVPQGDGSGGSEDDKSASRRSTIPQAVKSGTPE